MLPSETQSQTTLSGATPQSDAQGAGLALLRQRKVWVPLSLLVVIGCGLVLRAHAAAGVKPAPQVRAVPVTVATAKAMDLDVNYSGLGTVVTLDTVTVRSRVDGQVMKIGFHEGQMVRQGELLAEIDPRPYHVQLMQADGQLAKDRAALNNAEKDLARFRTLVAQGIISGQQADTQVSLVDQFAAAVKVDQAQVASAKLNLTYSHIVSPIAGRAGLRLVDAGNLVHATDTTGIVVITPVQPINVMFTLPADQLQAVVAGGRGGHVLTAQAYDRDLSAQLATGTLQGMDNQIDPGTGTIKLKALFKNENLALFPNQFVNVRLKVDTLHQAIVIPSAALQRSTQGSYLYVVKPDSTVELRPVEVKYTEGDQTAISKGVAAGEVVVTDGIEKLRPGAKVNIPSADGKGSKKAGK